MEGYFARDSLIRQVHSERAVGSIYGSRALCIGAANPLSYVATALHSTSLLAPFTRLGRTAGIIETIILGSRGEADYLLTKAQPLHRRVAGVLPVDAGPYRAGTTYSARDPELMLWTIAVIADSAIFFFELFIRPLSLAERAALWEDYLRLAELFGMQVTTKLASYTQLMIWWNLQLSELYLTPEAHQAGFAAAFQVPMPLYAAPVRRRYNSVLLGSLPMQVRGVYGLTYTSEDAVRFQKCVNVVRATLACTPRWLRCGRSNRVYGWVAKTEQRRIDKGEPTPRFAAPAVAGNSRSSV